MNSHPKPLTNATNVNQIRPDKYTPLTKAIAEGNNGEVRRLVEEHKVIVDHLDGHMTSPLLWAACGGNLTILSYLIEEAKADVSLKGGSGTSLLFSTMLRLSNLLTEPTEEDLLLETGVSVKHVLTYLVTNYTKPNLKKPDEVLRLSDCSLKTGYNVLHLAAYNYSNDPLLLKFLLKNGGDLQDTKKAFFAKDLQGATILHHAVGQGNLPLIKMLLESERELMVALSKETTLSESKTEGLANIKNSDGQTPFMLACILDRAEVAEFLKPHTSNLPTDVELNALKHKKTKEPKKTSSANFELLYKAAGKGDIAEVRRLILAKADVDETDTKNYFGALRAATVNHHFNVVKCLVEEGFADVNVVDKWASTALNWAAYVGDLEIVKYLIAAGTDMTIKSNDEHNSLIAAIRKMNSIINETNGHYQEHEEAQIDNLKRIAVIEYLLKNHVKDHHEEKKNEKQTLYIDHVDELGFTALHWAIPANQYHTDFLAYFLNTLSHEGLNAVFRLKDFEEENILHFAVRRGSARDIQQLLDKEKEVNASLASNVRLKPTAMLEGLNKKKQTPLELAKQLLAQAQKANLDVKKYQEIVAALKITNSNVEEFHAAAARGDVSALKRLMSKELIDAVNDKGQTALHIAVSRGAVCYDAVVLLIENNANMMALTAENDLPLELALECKDNLRIIEFLKNTMLGDPEGSFQHLKAWMFATMNGTGIRNKFLAHLKGCNTDKQMDEFINSLPPHDHENTLECVGLAYNVWQHYKEEQAEHAEEQKDVPLEEKRPASDLKSLSPTAAIVIAKNSDIQSPTAGTTVVVAGTESKPQVSLVENGRHLLWNKDSLPENSNEPSKTMDVGSGLNK